MRHPHHIRQERAKQSLLFIVAVLFFLFALTLFDKRRLHKPVATQPQPTPTYATPTSNIKANAITHLVLYDDITQQALTNQSVAFVVTSDCDQAALACPSTDPVVLTTDNEGNVSVNQTLIKKEPRLYVAGYRIAKYFTFIKPEEPETLTVLKPINNAKSFYNITNDTIPLGLTPADSQ